MITDVHARLSSSQVLLAARRRVYAAAALSLDWDPAHGGLLDSPFVRNAIREALSSGRPPEEHFPRIEDWPFGARAVAVGEQARNVPIVASPKADEVLSDVLSIIDPTGRSRFLTEADGARFEAAVARVAQASQDVEHICSSLVGDLMPHLSLIGILRRDDERPAVLSASLREFPGLVLLAEPLDALSASEALLHETSHCRFFDMAIVHDILLDPSPAGATFRPTWRPTDAWPLDQAVPALHAYAVLAEFARDLTALGRFGRVGAESLLPEAAARVIELSDWVAGQLDRLGSDAPALVSGLAGQPMPAFTARASSPIDRHTTVTVPSGVELTYASGDDRSVVARPGEPARLFVLGPDSGLVLKALMTDNSSGTPVWAAVDAYTRERRVRRSEAEIVVGDIIANLAASSLVTLDGGARQE